MAVNKEDCGINMGFGQVIICGKNRYYSKEAFSLVDETGIQDPVAAIEYLSDDLLQLAEVAEPPVPLEMVASFQGINSIIRQEMPGAGRLVPVSRNDYRIEVRASDPVGRQNFTICHEIGHTLIPSYGKNPTTKSDLLTGEFQRKNEEEFFSDIAARNLLLPEKLFRAQCMEISPSIDGLLELSNVFNASIEAVAIRLDQLQCWNCIPVVWELGLKPSQKKLEDQFALFGLEELSQPVEEYRVKFPAGNFLFPASRHIAMDSSIVSACLADGKFQGCCIMPTSGRDLECQVKAMAVPYRNEHGDTRQRIVSLVFTSQGQEAM